MMRYTLTMRLNDNQDGELYFNDTYGPNQKIGLIMN